MAGNYQLFVKNVTKATDWNGDPTANPVTNAGGIDFSAMAGTLVFPTFQGSGDGNQTCNFGQNAFIGSAPSGYNLGWPAVGGGFTTLDPAKLFGSAALSNGNLTATFNTVAGMAQAVDGYDQFQYYFETTFEGRDLFSNSFGGGVGANYFPSGDPNFWFANGGFKTGDNLGGAGITGGSLGSGFQANTFAIGSGLASGLFPYDNGDVLGFAVFLTPGMPPPPPTPAVLNMDNVVVTSLLSESPCTASQFNPAPLVTPSYGLRWSDTRGATWGNPVPQEQSTDPLSQPQWNRTGYARDRVFELFWSSAYKTAINGAFVEVIPWKS